MHPKFVKMKPLILCCALIFTCLFVCGPAHGDEKRDKFEAQFRQAQTLLKQDKLAEAYAAVQAAARIDSTRYEASGLAALVFLKDGKITAAREALADARKLAPAEASQKLDGIARLIETAAAATSTGATNSSKTMTAGVSATSALTGAARRKYDTLLVIVEEADQAKSAVERKRLLGELMEKSSEFVREFPDALPVWTLRAAASLELENERMAWEASSEMIRLGAENSDDTKIRQLLAKIDRKGWLKTPKQVAEMKAEEQKRAAEARAEEERRLKEAKAADEKRIAAERELAMRREAEEKRRKEELKAAAERREAEKLATEKSRQEMLAKRWENSLGMVFGPVPGTEVMFSIWETRVQDYQTFTTATRHKKPEKNRHSLVDDELGPMHPVIRVGSEDAKAFCDWLTRKEQSEGKLTNAQFYRLPTDEEWSAAVGLPKEEGRSWRDRLHGSQGIFPWGTQWPPPSGAGNFADARLREYTQQKTDNGIPESIPGYRDGFHYLAPVGQFPPNQFGLHDLAGNVAEILDDAYNGQDSYVARGSHWFNESPDSLRSAKRILASGRSSKSQSTGFRCVLVGKSSP